MELLVQAGVVGGHPAEIAAYLWAHREDYQSNIGAFLSGAKSKAILESYCLNITLPKAFDQALRYKSEIPSQNNYIFTF